MKRAEYKQAGDWRIVDPRVWNAAQEAQAVGITGAARAP